MNPNDSPRPGFAGVIAVTLMFAALARGAHDLWAATLVHAVFLLWTAAFIVAAHRRGEGGIRLPLLGPAVAVLTTAVVSTFFAANRFDAIFATKDLAAAMVAFFAGANVFRSDDDVELLVLLMVPVLWIEAATMAMQISAHGRLFVAAQGTLVNPNIQAGFAIFWVPPLAVRVARARAATPALPEKSRLTYFTAGLAAAVLAVLMAGSLWTITCLVVAGLVSLALRLKRRWPVTGLAAASLALVGAAVWYKFTHAHSGSDRLQWWVSAFRMFAEHPWFGIGPGGFSSAYPAYKFGTVQNTLFAHSLPLMVLAETGVAGGGAAIAFLLTWRRWSAPAFSARLGFVIGACLFIVATLANVGAEYLVNQITLALFMGIAVAAVAAPRWRPRLSATVLAVAGAVLLLPLLAAPFLASRLIVDGKERLASRDSAGALKRFDSAVQLDPSSWEAYDGRALARWSNPAATTEDRETAIIDIRSAVERNRLEGMLWLEEGEMLRDVGRREEARVALKKASELRRNDPRVAEALAKL